MALKIQSYVPAVQVLKNCLERLSGQSEAVLILNHLSKITAIDDQVGVFGEGYVSQIADSSLRDAMQKVDQFVQSVLRTESDVDKQVRQAMDLRSQLNSVSSELLAQIVNDPQSALSSPSTFLAQAAANDNTSQTYQVLNNPENTANPQRQVQNRPYQSVFGLVIANSVVKPRGDPCSKLISRISGVGAITVFAPITAIVEGVNAILHSSSSSNTVCLCMGCSEKH